MPKQENRPYSTLILVVLALSLLLSIFNVFVFRSSPSTSRKVLGTSVVTQETVLWEKYLAYNPDYLPGWKKLLVLAKKDQHEVLIEKASQQIIRLDPNYSF